MAASKTSHNKKMTQTMEQLFAKITKGQRQCPSGENNCNTIITKTGTYICVQLYRYAYVYIYMDVWV